MSTQPDGTARKTRMTRRTALQLLATGASGALVAACAPVSAPSVSAPSASAPSAGATGQPVKTPKPGGTLRLGSPVDLSRLDIHYRDDAQNVCFDRLTDYDDKWKPIPALAESWDMASDAKSVKLNLRKGVQFHNGRELTSDDVKFSYEHAKGLASTVLLEAKWWTIETPDKYTVVMKTDIARPNMFDAFFSVQIVGKEGYDASGNATGINGTGPFKFISWKQGSEHSYEKNRNYWMTGRPYFDGILVSVVTDPQGLIGRFEAGALDAVLSPSANDFLRLKADPKYTGLLDDQTSGTRTITVNAAKVPPWTNKRARQALFHAIDRDRYVNVVLKGLGYPKVLAWPKQSPAYDAAKDASRPYDLDKARSILKEAGVGPINDQEIIWTATTAGDGDLAQIFQSDMAKLGINLALKPLDNALRTQMHNDGTYKGFAIAGVCCAFLDPASAIVKSRFTTPLQNDSGPYISPTYTAICDKIQLEPDPTRRKALFDQYNDTVLDEAFFFPVGMKSTLTITKASVKGLRIRPYPYSTNFTAWSYDTGWFDS